MLPELCFCESVSHCGNREIQVTVARYIVADRRRRTVGARRLSPSQRRPQSIAPAPDRANHAAPDEVYVGRRYPGAVRLLIGIGLSIALWCLVLFLAATIFDLLQQR